MYEYIKWILGVAGAVLVIAGFFLTIHVKTEPSNEPRWQKNKKMIVRMINYNTEEVIYGRYN